MGRPRKHDEATGRALLAAAEAIVESGGVDALSMRSVASWAGTTTRAVYSVFGSKDVLVAALGAHAFHVLGDSVESLITTGDPAADLVEAGARGFRSFACEHPSLFRLAIQQSAIPTELVATFRPAAEAAMAGLEQRLARLEQARLLGGRSVHDAVCQFHALCEGLAALELRGVFSRESDPERLWREALSALIGGFAIAPGGAPKASPSSALSKVSRD